MDDYELTRKTGKVDMNRKSGEKKQQSGSPACSMLFVWRNSTQGIRVQEKQASGGMRCGEAGRSTGEEAAEQPNVERILVL